MRNNLQNKGFQATAHKLSLCDRLRTLQSYIVLPVGRRLNPDVGCKNKTMNILYHTEIVLLALILSGCCSLPPDNLHKEKQVALIANITADKTDYRVNLYYAESENAFDTNVFTDIHTNLNGDTSQEIQKQADMVTSILASVGIDAPDSQLSSGYSSMLSLPTFVAKPNTWAEISLFSTNSPIMCSGIVHLNSKDVRIEHPAGLLANVLITPKKLKSVRITGYFSASTFEGTAQHILIPFDSICALEQNTILYSSKLSWIEPENSQPTRGSRVPSTRCRVP